LYRIRPNRQSPSAAGRIVPRLFVLFILLALSVQLWAKPVSKNLAKKTANRWMTLEKRPLNAGLKPRISHITTCKDARDRALYYTVNLTDGGFVIIAADDLVEPIICISPAGQYQPDPNNPLTTLLNSDLEKRISRAEQIQSKIPAKYLHSNREKSATSPFRRQLAARKKWSALAGEPQISAGAKTETQTTAQTSSISEVIISPLIESTWAQGSLGGEPLYNYYTPYNYPCGCVATAMAQVMRYHQYPLESVGRPLLGGNEKGGPYIWSNMPLKPDSSVTETQRKAIGALCYDAGKTIDTDYGSGGSSAYMSDAKQELIDTFYFDNAVLGSNSNNDIGPGLTSMINPNLDAGYPVMLGIIDNQEDTGHAIVCDGYGYDLDTPYHHLNMGWGGISDVWYNLPDVLDFNAVYSCIYNIFASGTGEIISGRITDQNDIPLEGIIVTAEANGQTIDTDTTDSNGIYALTKLPSDTDLTVTAQQSGYVFEPEQLSTGNSADYQEISGNIWGVDFVTGGAGALVSFDRDTYPAIGNAVLTLSDPNAASTGSQNVTIVSSDGDSETITLTEQPADSGTFTAVFTIDPNWPCPGDGKIQAWATDTIDACYENNTSGRWAQDQAQITSTVYQTGFDNGLPASWTITDGYQDERTWTSINPRDRTSSYWEGGFMIVDSDWAGRKNMDELLSTEPLDFSGLNSLRLRFGHDFYFFSNAVGEVNIRIGSGDWQNLTNFANGSSDGIVELDLPAEVENQQDVQLAWHYTAYYDYYWGIDNVEITAGNLEKPIPGDTEPNGCVDLADLRNFADAWLSSYGQDNWNTACNVGQSADDMINANDFAVLADNWHRQAE